MCLFGTSEPVLVIIVLTSLGRHVLCVSIWIPITVYIVCLFGSLSRVTLLCLFSGGHVGGADGAGLPFGRVTTHETTHTDTHKATHITHCATYTLGNLHTLSNTHTK